MKILASESVRAGHPDKICDQVADAILDAALEQDPMARVACECVTTTGLFFIMGEITTRAVIPYEETARKTLLEIGYDRGIYGLDGQSCGVILSIKEQSADIASGILGKKGYPKSLGAGDQGMMIGYASRESASFLPLPLDLSHRLMRRLDHEWKAGRLPFLGPDGKGMVTVAYEENGAPSHIETVLVSTQHLPEANLDEVRAEVTEKVIRPVMPERLFDQRTAILINPAGRFALGGPAADSGLTGRKLLVDTYGGLARHGGGSFSGKDPTKVDRSGAYMARHVAKNLVAAGLADRLEIQVSYAIGKSLPVSISIDAYGTGKESDATLLGIIRKSFDFRPGAIIERFGLRRPLYRQTAAYGHFGRDDLDLPWERLDAEFQ